MLLLSEFYTTNNKEIASKTQKNIYNNKNTSNNTSNYSNRNNSNMQYSKNNIRLLVIK